MFLGNSEPMNHNRVYVLWMTTGGLDEDAHLIGIYSSEERATDRIVRCRQLPGYSSGRGRLRDHRSDVDHDERQRVLIDA